MITARLTEKEYIIQIVPNTVQEKKKGQQSTEDVISHLG